MSLGIWANRIFSRTLVSPSSTSLCTLRMVNLITDAKVKQTSCEAVPSLTNCSSTRGFTYSSVLSHGFHQNVQPSISNVDLDPLLNSHNVIYTQTRLKSKDRGGKGGGKGKSVKSFNILTEY